MKRLFSTLFLFVFLIKLSFSYAPLYLDNVKEGAFAALFMQWELEEQGTPDGESAKEKTAKEKHNIDEKYDHHIAYNVLISNSDLNMHDKLSYHVEAYHPTVPTPPPLV